MNIYLDNAATTELSCSMKQYLTSVLDLWGNPSSLHSTGEKTRQLISDARQSVAAFINAKPEDIYFTPSGSGSNTLAIKGLTSENPQTNHYEVFCSPTAHKSMLLACKSCICHTLLKVNSFGELDIGYLEDILAEHNHLKPLVCIEAGNSEIGTINDVVTIGSIVHRYDGILIVDATGYIPSYKVNIAQWEKYVDLLTFSGHKLHALEGIGVLWKHQDTQLTPLIYGSQEQTLIGGTENILGIASLRKAVETYNYSSVTPNNRNHIYHYIIHHIPDSYLVGAPIESGKRLPHNLYLCFKGVEGESLMILLDLNGIQVSTGSACNSRNLSASPALSAIGMDEHDIHSCIRLTLSGKETAAELDYVCNKLKQCVEFLRKLNTK